MIANDPKRLDEATLLIDKALVNSPGNTAVEGSAGWLYYQTRRYPKAVTHLRAALGNGTNSSTRYRLAAACMMAGDKECAVDQYEAALKQNPGDPTRALAANLLGRQTQSKQQ